MLARSCALGVVLADVWWLLSGRTNVADFFKVWLANLLVLSILDMVSVSDMYMCTITHCYNCYMVALFS